jgi:hypothetical protein
MANPVDIIETAEGVPLTASQSTAVANLAAQAANTLTGNNTGSPAAAGGLTVAQVKTLLAYVATDLNLDALVRGTAIADSSITIHPGTDKASQYVLTGPLSTNRTTTLDGAGTPATGHSVWLTRRDLTANTWTIADSALGTIIVLPASPATPVAVCVTWNGANWGSSPSSVQYLTA